MNADVQWQAALEVLQPFNSVVEAAFARGGQAEALQVAFERMVQAADLVSAGDEPADGMARVRCLWLDLEPRPLVALTDGTLSEAGDYVNMAYQRWNASAEEAEALWAWMVEQMQSQALAPDAFESGQ